MLELKHQRSENQHLAQHVKSVQSTWPTVHESFCIYHNQPRVLPHLWPEATVSFTVVWMKTVSWLHTRTHTCTNLHMFSNAALLLDSWCFPREKMVRRTFVVLFFLHLKRTKTDTHVVSHHSMSWSSIREEGALRQWGSLVADFFMTSTGLTTALTVDISMPGVACSLVIPRQNKLIKYLELIPTI